jgi:pimeloyl-ACP methyl ester carboxylesterase
MSLDHPRFRVTVSPGLELSLLRRDPDGLARAAFLLVHGLASNARTWDGVAEELARHGVASVAVDLRGHGHSDKPDAGYSVAEVAADLAALIGHLELGRPVVAGQSWGGNVVLELAVRHPELLRGVVAVDGGIIELSREFPDWEACAQELAPPLLAGRHLAEIEGWIRAAHPDWPERGIAGTLANFEVRPDGTVAPWLTRERHMAVLRGLWEHAPSALLPRVAVPVLLAPAESDRDDHARAVTQRHDVETALAALPRARVAWFRHADHDVHVHRPVELAAAMLGALDDGFFDP